MSKMQATTIEEEAKISFTGLDADSGVIDARDLIRALDGWREYWEITNSSFFSKKLSTKPSSIRTEIKIKALKHATFDIWGQVIIPLGLMAGYDILKRLWKWRKSLLKQHINNKKGFITKEEAVENIKKLAENFEILSESDIETTRLLDSVDEALNLLVEPIDRSAEKIIINSSSSQQPLSLTSNDKRTLGSGYHLEIGVAKLVERFNVKFLRIHTETGNAIITFDDLNDINRMGHQYSTIIDPAVKTPKNIYTRALHEGTFIEVWCRKVFNKINNNFLHWEISKDLPSDDTPLLDIGNDE